MRTLLLTGATGGLGTAVVERLSRDYRCIALVRSKGKPLPIDSIASIDELREPVYGAVLLAGGFAMGAEAFEPMLEANLMSAVRTIEPLRPRIEDGGRIVAISSAASLTKPKGLAAYVASKAALNAYLEVLAKDLAPRRITVNALLPTALDTPAMRGSMPREQLVPLDRVAEAIVFLLREEASVVTGQLIALTP